MENTSTVVYISATKSLNWYQMIAMTMSYNHVIRYINKLAILRLKFEKRTSDIREK